MRALFLHELKRLLRGRRTVLLLGLNVVLAYIAAAASMGAAPLRGGASVHDAVAALTVVELTLGLLFIPILVAGTIAGERDQGTLESLVGVPVPWVAIVASKAFASLLYCALFFLAPLPCVATLVLFGGIDMPTLIEMQGVLLVALLGATGLSVLASQRASGATTAVGRAVGWVMLWNIGIPAGIVMLAQFPLVADWGAGVGIDEELAIALSPFTLVTWGLAPTGGTSDSGLYTVATVGVALLALAISAFSNPSAPDATAPTARRSRRRRRVGPFAAAALALGRRGYPGFQNPVLQRGLLTAEHGGLLYELLCLVAPFGAFAFFLVGTPDPLDAALGSAHGTLLVVFIVVPIVAAPSIPRERERRTIGMLASTSIDPWAVARGKIFAVVIPSLGFVLSSCLLAASWLVIPRSPWSPISVSTVHDGFGFALVAFTIGTSIWVAAAFSIAVSFASKNGVRATIAAFLLQPVVHLASALFLSSPFIALRAMWGTSLEMLIPYVVFWPLIGCFFWGIAASGADRVIGAYDPYPLPQNVPDPSSDGKKPPLGSFASGAAEWDRTS